MYEPHSGALCGIGFLIAEWLASKIRDPKRTWVKCMRLTYPRHWGDGSDGKELAEKARIPKFDSQHPSKRWPWQPIILALKS